MTSTIKHYLFHHAEILPGETEDYVNAVVTKVYSNGTIEECRDFMISFDSYTEMYDFVQAVETSTEPLVTPLVEE